MPSSDAILFGAAAVASSNRFNAAVFAGLFVGLVALATRLSNERVCFGAAWLTVPGASLIAFGLRYPHFLETEHGMTYAYAAPLGLLRCPTLSAVLGITLTLRLLGARLWALSLGRQVSFMVRPES